MQRILIIGATSAIAHATARIWAEQGAAFFLVGRNSEKLQQNADDLRIRGACSVTAHVLDVTETQRHAEMLEHCLQELEQIDIALIAHGTLPDQQQCEEDTAAALREFNLNATTVIALANVLAQHFAVQRYGAMAVISSVAGDRGRPSNYLYGSAKAAVSTFCEGLHARLYKQGVHVMTVKPGFVDTPMTHGLPLPQVLVVSPEIVARDIVSGFHRRKAVLYTPGFWRGIMLVITAIPTFVFKRLNL